MFKIYKYLDLHCLLFKLLEPVENVQEPEESDVCLIPDDSETTITDAEKEQAILARENAEKEGGAAAAENEEGGEKNATDETAAAAVEPSYSHEARGKFFF